MIVKCDNAITKALEKLNMLELFVPDTKIAFKTKRPFSFEQGVIQQDDVLFITGVNQHSINDREIDLQIIYFDINHVNEPYWKLLEGHISCTINDVYDIIYEDESITNFIEKIEDGTAELMSWVYYEYNNFKQHQQESDRIYEKSLSALKLNIFISLVLIAVTVVFAIFSQFNIGFIVLNAVSAISLILTALFCIKCGRYYSTVSKTAIRSRLYVCRTCTNIKLLITKNQQNYPYFR